MSLLAYFLLTFLIAWAVWFAAAALAAPGNTGFFGIRGPVFLLGVFAPAHVSLALTARAEGPAGVRRLLACIGHWRVGARWYAFAVGYFAAIKLTAALVHRVARNEWPRFGDTPLALILLRIMVSTLEGALGTSAEMWLNMQTNHDLWHARKRPPRVRRMS